jgi:AIPR protein
MPPKSPEQIVLESLFNHFHSTEYPEDEADDVFEIFSASHVLKPRNFTSDDIASGIVDGTKDGGIDSFYVFVNGILLSSDDPLLVPGSEAVKKINTHPHLEVFLIQSKNKDSWEEGAWEHLLASLASLLDWDAKDAELEKHFSAAVVERTGILRRTIESLATKFPKINFNLVYVTRAREENITDTIQLRAAQVGQLVQSSLMAGAEVKFSHVGAKELYRLAGIDYSDPGILNFHEIIRADKSYLGIVTLEDYLDFVRSEDGELRDELFESNVRDYEGDNSVNEAIRATLATDEDAEFWWLNNGVTVLGTEVDGPRKRLVIKQPLIVNGLQTTHVLDQAEKDGTLVDSRRSNGIVVRVIESDDEDTRDKVIAGTNRQTQVPSVALYATQELQRNIERFLLVYNWYYERRKNRYKNQGKPAKRRITINLLAQAMITLMLGQPDGARARPSTLLSSAGGYSSVFPNDLNPEAYLRAIELVKAIDEYLRTDDAKAILDEYTNARFYVAAGYEILNFSIKDTSDLHFRESFHSLKPPFDKAKLEKSLSVLADTADKYSKKNPGASRDSIFKSSEFRAEYFNALIAITRRAAPK